MESSLMDLPEDVGVCEVDGTGRLIRLKREYYGQGLVFKSWDAFYNKPDAPCYVSELSDFVWTAESILKLCNGQENFAQVIFQLVDWQSPETVLEELLHDGEWVRCSKCGNLIDCGDGSYEGYPYCEEIRTGRFTPERIVNKVFQALSQSEQDSIDWKLDEEYGIYIEKQDVLTGKKQLVIELHDTKTEDTIVGRIVCIEGTQKKVKERLLHVREYVSNYVKGKRIAIYQAKEILRRLHTAGGCGAEKESWSDGWDKAVDEAIRIVEEVSGVSIMEILDEQV